MKIVLGLGFLVMLVACGSAEATETSEPAPTATSERATAGDLLGGETLEDIFSERNCAKMRFDRAVVAEEIDRQIAANPTVAQEVKQLGSEVLADIDSTIAFCDCVPTTESMSADGKMTAETLEVMTACLDRTGEVVGP
jgi:hypothetical protein